MIPDAGRPPRSILVRAPNWIGDQVIAYPFFYFLRRAFPTARIRTVCVPWVNSIQFQDLVNEITVLEIQKNKGLPARFEALENCARQIRDEGPWDLGISLPNSLSAAWLLFRAGCNARRGYAGDGRSLLLNDRVSAPVTSVNHRAQAYMDLLPRGARPEISAGLFWGVAPENDLDPGIPSITKFDPAKSWAGAQFLEAPPDDYFVLAPGSVGNSRRWPLELFAELADKVTRERDWKVVIAGGVAEAGAADRMAQRMKYPERIIDQAGKGASVSSFARIFEKARFTVSNDSGLAHVASICGCPVHIVWGAGNPNRTAPVGPGKTKMTLNPVECWPCERNECTREDKVLECLRPIEPDRVWEEIKRGLRV